MIQSSFGSIPRGVRGVRISLTFSADVSLILGRVSGRSISRRMRSASESRERVSVARLLSVRTCRFYRRKPFHPLVRRFDSRITPPRSFLNTASPLFVRLSALAVYRSRSKVVWIIYFQGLCNTRICNRVRTVIFGINNCFG